MLKSKETEAIWHPKNKKHFESRGYIFTKNGDKFMVKVSDLLPRSKFKVEVKCDYCGIIYDKNYAEYARLKNKYIENDACDNCASKKREDILNYKIENNNLSVKDRGFWMIKDNVFKELNSFIIEYGFIGRTYETHKRWRMIIFGLENIDVDLKDAIAELGYNIEDLRLRKPNGYYDDFEVLENNIKSFINKYNRFPTQLELIKELGIYDYSKHGTLEEIKSKMGYCDKQDLVDNSGFINKSRYELIVANYLIAQNVPYLREQYPFKKYDDNLNYRSDFTFTLLDDSLIHCEVWGGARIFKNQTKYFDYEETMKEKIELYKKYNIKLISIFPNIFYNGIKNIKKDLYKIFEPYFQLQYKEMKQPLLSTYTLKQLSNEELLKEIMQYSLIEDCLPTTNHLRELKKEYLYVEVLKRFDSYNDFANTFNVHTARKSKKLAS